MSDPAPVADENTKLTIKERIEQSRALDRKRSTRKIIFIFGPLVVLLILLFVFWNSLAFLWISLNIRYGDQETRLDYLKVLVERQDQRGRRHFISALDGNIFERNVGLKGLRFAGDSSLCNKFMAIYKDRNDTYKDPVNQITNREIAVELVAQYGGTGYMDFFISLLSEGNPWWGYGWEYLKTHATPDLRPKLLDMLDSDDALDRLRAEKALYWLRDKPWVKESRGVLEKSSLNCSHENWKVRMWACKIIAELGGKDYVPNLLEQIEKEFEKEELAVVQFISDALGDIGDTRSVPKLVKLLRSPDYPASSSAQIALIKIGSLSAVPGLIEVIKDKSVERESRVGALQVIPRLIETEGKAALELPDVQWTLISIIRSADPNSPVESSSDLAVRIESARIVCSSLIGGTCEPLRYMPDEDVLMRVAKAWAKKDIRKAVFEAFTEESNSTVKSLLCDALAQIQYPELGRHLINWAPDAHPSEKKTIAEAFRILTATSGNREGTDFGFGKARTNEEIIESAKKAEEWLASRSKSGNMNEDK
ncbi:MAG: HEAT repeat domain-containing protein [Planctomycetota bacterium]|jgi:hypothetical protein